MPSITKVGPIVAKGNPAQPAPLGGHQPPGHLWDTPTKPGRSDCIFQNANPFESAPEPQAMIATEFVRDQPPPFESGELLPSLVAELNSFAQQISAMDRSILEGHRLTSADEEAVSSEFQRLLRDFDRQSRALQSVNPSVANSIGRDFQARMLPYLLLTGTAERWYSKPRGYAGDYLTIHQVYENRPNGRGRIGALLYTGT